MLLVYVLFLILTANLCTGKFNAGKYFNSQNMGSGGYSGEPEENNPANGTMYDFIIVGAGTTGGVVAARLAQLKKYKVLLLEAGPFPPWTTVVPYLRADVRHHTPSDWNVVTVPQIGLNNRTIEISQGKMVGGTSATNGMIYMRGNPKDYDRWANETGDPSWKYLNLLKYFKKMETYSGSFPNDPDHGSSGPLTINDINYRPLSDEFIAAGRELGFPYSDQNSRDQQSSFSPVQLNTLRGRRHSVYEGYIYPTWKKRQLNLLANAYVIKINLNDTTATSVTLKRHNQIRTYFAKREIILSAGVVKTPQLLMLSGIGPREHLESLGITTLVDLPVGQGLQDHFSTEMGPFLLSPGSGYIESRDLTQTQIANYMINGTGPLSFGYITGMGLWNTEGSHSWPNMLYEQILLPTRLRGQAVDSVSAFSALGTPYSRGSVKLRSNNPYDSPLVDPGYNSDPRDKADAVKGCDFIRNFYEGTATFKRLGSRWINVNAPKCPGFGERNSSTEFMACYINTVGGTGYHLGGSVPMGREDDEKTVLDSELKVKGVKGLRVADASIMPAIVNTNTQIACNVIGEKAADLVEQQYRWIAG